VTQGDISTPFETKEPTLYLIKRLSGQQYVKRSIGTSLSGATMRSIDPEDCYESVQSTRSIGTDKHRPTPLLTAAVFQWLNVYCDL